VIIYLWPNVDTFACSDYNKETVINYNACYNDKEGCTVMIGTLGKASCTIRDP
jgi:hypothetical protein